MSDSSQTIPVEVVRVDAPPTERHPWRVVIRDATGFGERSGLLTAGYRRKPAFGAYRALIARYGARQLSSPVADVGRAN